MNLSRLHTRQDAREPYRVQYAPASQSLLNGLDRKVREAIVERVYAASKGDPYAHGAPSLNRDRRVVEIEGVTVVYFVSEMVRVLTVVDIIEDL